MRFLPLLPLLALAACATPETRVRTSLVEAGLPPPVAKCMAQRMVDRLSLVQLNRLSSLSRIKSHRIGDMTVAQFLYEARALGDPRVVEVLTTAGLGCAIAS